MHLRRTLAIVLCAVAGAAAPAVRAAAATLEVPAEYASIQEAIAAAVDGDTVRVAPGIYAGPITLAGKTVFLRSHFGSSGDPATIDQTVIDGGGGSFAIFVDDTVGPATTIQGFTIQNADDGVRVDGQFRLLDSHVTGAVDGVDYKGGGGLVQRCLLEGNQDDGLDLDDAVAIVIQDNDIVANGGSPSLDGDGIEIRLQNYQGPEIQVVIRNNRIDGNTSDGIQLIDYGIPTNRLIRIEGNTFVGNRLAAIGSMCCTDSEENFAGADLAERVVVVGNTFVGNDHAITGGDNMVVLNNLFVDSAGPALKRLREDSIAAYNLFWNNGTDASDAIVDLASSLELDPLLAPDQSLLPGSPAIDAGTAFYQHLAEVVLDLPPSAYAGPAPDLGAFELGAAAPGNDAPAVDAGPDQVLPIGFAASLNGLVADDGLPAGILTLGWSQISGPGPVSFDDPSLEDPVVSLPGEGTYVLRLTADDSDLVAIDDVVIQVVPDATLVALSVASGADDAQENLATAGVSLAGGVLELGVAAGSQEPQQVALRWEDVPIPAGDVVYNAWVQFEAALPDLDPADLAILGEPAGAAAPFAATPGDLSARSLTVASVPWNPSEWLAGEADLAERTPDLAPILREIVDSPGWQEGDALALHFLGSGARQAVAFDADPAGAAQLHVVYGPPPVNQPPLVEAGQDLLLPLGDAGELSGEVSDDGLPKGQPLSFLWTVENGPPGASIDPPSDLATQAYFTSPGVYLLRLTADDGELSSFDELVVTVFVNQPPQVDVGADQQILLPASASLAAAVSDDGYPGPLTLLWTMESGPGSVQFSAPAAAASQASFSEPGLYVLRLSADDGDLVAFDQLEVEVLANQPPTVDAGPDQSLLLPASAALDASVGDDGVPTGQLAVSWSVTSGPGAVSFQPQDAAASEASFSEPGVYILRLTASDGAAEGFDELSVTVHQNQPPLVDAGPDRSIQLGESASLAGSVGDDGFPLGQLDLLWTLESGPGSASIGVPSDRVSQASFSQPGVYVLRLTADDGELEAFDEMRVAVAFEDVGVLDLQIGDPDDDVEQEVKNGNINLESTVLDLGWHPSPPREQIAGLRFPGVVVPGGASILQALLQFQAADKDAEAIDLTIWAEASDDAEPFSDDADDLSSRVPTLASVAWSPPPWQTNGAAGPDQAVDVSGPLQEVIGRPGWSAGHAVALMIAGDGTRRAETYEGDASGAARLHVEYDAARCTDGLDNDGDGLVDFPADPGCASATSDIENPACDDGLDNDGDGAIDSPTDDDCLVPSLDVEVASPGLCGNGFLDPPEVCDDGNTLSGDSCFRTCEAEHSVQFEGNPAGSGSVTGTLESVTKTVSTTGLSGGDEVADAMAEAFNADPLLTWLAVEVDPVANAIYSNGSFSDFSSSDTGVDTVLPEPDATLLLLSGLGCLAVLGRRRFRD